MTIAAPQAWLFDLDDTLYPESAGIFRQVRYRIRRYIQDHLGLDEEAAKALQRRLRDDHGTSLNGLMSEAEIDPDHFLDYVHDVDMSALVPNPALRAVIERLPGRKIIFTNADARYGARVLTRLGLDGDIFEGMYDIRAADFVPKPRPATYERIVSLYGLNAQGCLMIDDRLANLETARQLGMRTAWTRPSSLADHPLPDYVHYDAADILAFLSPYAS